MDGSIIPGVVIGVMVAVASGYVSHVLRKREMDRHWAEEERRRKSDRRRELYERELGALKDSVDGLMEALARMELSIWSHGLWRPLSESMADAYLVKTRARVLPVPLEHKGLADSYWSLLDLFQQWYNLADWGKDDPFEGKSEEVARLKTEIESAASKVSCRIVEILKEVCVNSL